MIISSVWIRIQVFALLISSNLFTIRYLNNNSKSQNVLSSQYIIIVRHFSNVQVMLVYVSY